jgi:two-component system LytT family response regulator
MSNRFSVLVLDDEKDARKMIAEYCTLYAPYIDKCFECSSIDEAQKVLKAETISLIFLDIQLKNESGFNLLNNLGYNSPSIIFTTAHQQYAARAFRMAAIDYLLKPIVVNEFKESIQKFIDSKSLSVNEIKMSVLLENLSQPLNEVNRIAIPVKDGIVFEPINQIVYVEGDSNYSNVYTLKGDKYLVSKTLKYFEELLPNCFQRIHKSYLVNLNYVKSYQKDTDTVKVLNETMLPVSTRAKADLLQRFKMQ